MEIMVSHNKMMLLRKTYSFYPIRYICHTVSKSNCLVIQLQSAANQDHRADNTCFNQLVIGNNKSSLNLNTNYVNYKKAPNWHPKTPT